MPTIKDVAKEAGVSIATVSYVINNKSDSISSTTRELVLETAQRIGYTPNITARNLRFSRTHLIGYAWHEVPYDHANPVMDRFTYHLAQTAEEANYHILTFTHPTENPMPVYDELIRMRRVDGFVLSAIQMDDPRIEMLLNRPFPFVTFGRSNPDWDFSWVDIDNEQGTYKAIEYLVELGHRRIAMVGWDHNNTSASHYRLKGFHQAVRDFDISFRDDYLFLGPYGYETGHKAVAYWADLPIEEQPTAVFAISDQEATGIMNEAQKRGLEIGKDLSVIGFDNVPMSQYLHPALTTFHQPIAEAAKLLIKMLESILHSGKTSERQVLLPPQLIHRGSCGPPAQSE